MDEPNASTDAARPSPVCDDTLVRISERAHLPPTLIALVPHLVATLRRRAATRSAQRRHAGDFADDQSTSEPVSHRPDCALECGDLEPLHARLLANLPSPSRRAFVLVRECNVPYRRASTAVGVTRVTICGRSRSPRSASVPRSRPNASPSGTNDARSAPAT